MSVNGATPNNQFTGRTNSIASLYCTCVGEPRRWASWDACGTIRASRLSPQGDKG